MTLHMFNPGHDIALAANIEAFTPPRAARQLRHDLGFLPALWASPGDAVLVDDPTSAIESMGRLAEMAKEHLGLSLPPFPHRPCDCTQPQPATVNFVEAGHNLSLPNLDAVAPWGWNLALRAQLRRQGVAEDIMPSNGQLQDIRRLSHRRTAAQLLRQLISGNQTSPPASPLPLLTSHPYELCTIDEVTTRIEHLGLAVIKAPWSSSGRGIRFVTSHPLPPLHPLSPLPPSHPSPITPQLKGWLRNILLQQGSVMVEPYFDKLKDFAMEFHANDDGTVNYCGLSLFHTNGGAYTGNILASEQTKRKLLATYIPLQTIDHVKEAICRHLPTILQGCYQGPLGIDMMIVRDPQAAKGADTNVCPLVHPCVEINLRRTMGHVALALTPASDDMVGVMHINHSNNSYSLHLSAIT